MYYEHVFSNMNAIMQIPTIGLHLGSGKLVITGGKISEHGKQLRFMLFTV